MIINIIGKLWSKTPRPIRLRLIRLSQKKFTASVAAIITNDENKVLLLEHVLRPHSNWGLPGGFIEVGEPPEDAIRREISEETGLELIGIKLFRVRTIGQHIEILFTAKAKGTAAVKSREINNLGWFDLDYMPLGMSAAQIAIVRSVLQNL